MIPVRLYAYAAAVVALLASFWGYGHYQKIQGRAEIQAKFDDYIQRRTTDTLQASLLNQEVSLLKQKSVDKSRERDFENAKKLESANVGLSNSVAGLRNTIATFDHSAKTGDAAQARAGIDEPSKVARELLSECARRYQDMAKDAGELAAQAIGLQGFIDALMIQ